MLDAFFNIYNYYFDMAFEFIFGVNPESSEGIHILFIVFIASIAIYVGSSLLINELSNTKQIT